MAASSTKQIGVPRRCPRYAFTFAVFSLSRRIRLPLAALAHSLLSSLCKFADFMCVCILQFLCTYSNFVFIYVYMLYIYVCVCVCVCVCVRVRVCVCVCVCTHVSRARRFFLHRREALVLMLHPHALVSLVFTLRLCCANAQLFLSLLLSLFPYSPSSSFHSSPLRGSFSVSLSFSPFSSPLPCVSLFSLSLSLSLSL